jgi:transposase
MHKRLLAYAGCEPRIRESGSWKGRKFISKRGSRQLRTALYLLANNIRQWDPYFKAVYERKIGAGKHHNVAVFYVVAKLIEVLCALYKSRRNYAAIQP